MPVNKYEQTSKEILAQDEVLISEEEIKKRVVEMAQEIDQAYGQTRILMVGVLNGATIFMADLARELGKLNHPVNMNFVKTRRYGENNEPLETPVIDLDISDKKVEGRHVLLVDDVFDEGGTLAFLERHFAKKNPASINKAVLLRKPAHKRQVEVGVNFVGFDIKDRWVYGYGMNREEGEDAEYRNLPYVAAKTTVR